MSYIATDELRKKLQEITHDNTHIYIRDKHFLATFTDLTPGYVFGQIYEYLRTQNMEIVYSHVKELKRKFDTVIMLSVWVCPEDAIIIGIPDNAPNSLNTQQP